MCKLYAVQIVVCPSTELHWLICLVKLATKLATKKLQQIWVRLGLLKYSIQAPQVETSGFRGSAPVHAQKQRPVSLVSLLWKMEDNWITVGFFPFVPECVGYCCQKVKSDGCIFVLRSDQIIEMPRRVVFDKVHSAHPRSRCWTSFSAAWWAWRLSVHTFREWSRWFEMVMGW